MRRIKLFHADNWLRSPADREIIARWSSPVPEAEAVAVGARHRVRIEGTGVEEGQEWAFLVLGDTGDSDASGPLQSPQDAVARELTRDAVAPVGNGAARMVLHTGDIIYMAGERRLYERNFRRPYAAFLTDESTVDNLVFRLPFLPVPGNHDYYDLGGWASWLSGVPLVSRGLRAIAHRFLGFRLPEGGSDMGRAFMDAFMELSPAVRAEIPPDVPLPYECGARTRLPHRYYQFTLGGVDFFALDSNTLDAPPPEVSPETVRRAADQRIVALEQELGVLEAELKRDQKADEAERGNARLALASDAEQRTTLVALAGEVQTAVERLAAALPSAETGGILLGNAARKAVDDSLNAWKEASSALSNAATTESAAAALLRLDTIGDQVCDALSALQPFLSQLPGGSEERSHINSAADTVERSQARWSAVVNPGSSTNQQRILHLSERVLDIQRELALEQRRQRYESTDFDTAQLDWLEAALTAAQSARPNNWRVVFLHHPLYTSIYNHCERPDVRGLRGNLLRLLQAPGRVHLVLSGHSHAFEWFRSAALPQTALFVTGGGGQIAVRSSVFASRYRDRSFKQRAALAEAGVQECAVNGRGPVSPDGHAGSVYHYLRVVVRPDRLRIYPVGVRLLHGNDEERRRFRREEPMPVYHIAEVPRTPTQRVPRSIRLLEYVEVRRDQSPEAHWAEDDGARRRGASRRR